MLAQTRALPFDQTTCPALMHGPNAHAHVVHMQLQNRPHLSSLHWRLWGAYPLRVHARIVEGLSVPQRCRVGQVVQPTQHDSHKGTRPPVASPTVDVQLLAPQHALHAILSKPGGACKPREGQET
eukprot:1140483-Pelagomonas_calceolata.AAC.1